MFVLNFTIYGNPDRGQSDWKENHTLQAPTMQELRANILRFQGENDIGGGNWGEAVLIQDRSVVGYMSYNTRVWSSQKYSEAVELNI